MKERKQKKDNFEVELTNVTEISNESDIDEILNKKLNSFILQFNPENNKCLFICNQYKIHEEWDYKEGDEQELTNRAIERIKSCAKRTFIFNLAFLAFMILLVLTGVSLTITNFANGMLLLGVRSLAQVILLLMCTVKPYTKHPSSSVIGVLGFIIGWMFFFDHSYLSGTVYIILGGLYILKY